MNDTKHEKNNILIRPQYIYILCGSHLILLFSRHKLWNCIWIDLKHCFSHGNVLSAEATGSVDLSAPFATMSLSRRYIYSGIWKKSTLYHKSGLVSGTHNQKSSYVKGPVCTYIYIYIQISHKLILPKGVFQAHDIREKNKDYILIAFCHVKVSLKLTDIAKKRFKWCTSIKFVWIEKSA